MGGQRAWHGMAWHIMTCMAGARHAWHGHDTLWHDMHSMPWLALTRQLLAWAW